MCRTALLLEDIDLFHHSQIAYPLKDEPIFNVPGHLSELSENHISIKSIGIVGTTSSSFSETGISPFAYSSKYEMFTGANS